MQSSDVRLELTAASPSWDTALAALAGRDTDVYFSAAYHRLCEADGDGIGVASLMKDGNSGLFIPGMRAPIPNTDRWDLQSCNGYSGPLGGPHTSPESLTAMWNAWIKSRKDDGAVAAFFRMHPLLDNVQWLPPNASVHEDRETVYVPLEEGVDELLRNASSRHRNMLNRGAKAGAEVRWAGSVHAMWDNFASIYSVAMTRLAAPSRLKFSASYFEALRKLGCADIAGIVDADGLVSGAVFLFGFRWAHYHLAARRKDAPNFAANVLIQAGIERAARLGLDGVHLGGGVTRGADDSLLRFKSSIGGEIRRFSVARVIIDPVAFASMSSPAAGTDAVNWLLPYRHPSLALV